MAATRSIRQALTALLAVVVLTSTFVAPVHAADDDGGITIDGDGIDIGGDDGTGITVGDDENGTETDVSASADEDGASLSTDGELSVNEGGDAGGSLSLSCDFSTNDTDVSDDCDSNVVPEDDGDGSLPSVDDAPDAPEGDLPAEDFPGLPSSDGDSDPMDTSVLPVLETLGPVLEQAPTGELSREFDEEDLPAGTEDVLGPVPFEPVPVSPQDAPIGSESLADCAFPVRGDDVPLEAVPGPSDLPFQPPALPGVPTSLLTPEAVGGIALGAPPDGCEAYDPDDPSVDPTAPPTNVDFDRRNFASEASGDRVVWVDEYNVETEEGQDGQLFWSFLLSEDRIVATEDLTVSDGQTEDYVGLESSAVADRNLSEGGTASTVVYLFGSGLGGNVVCDGTECQASPVGLLDPGVPAIPTGGSGGGVPCEVPVGEEVPEPPSVPEPPEQVPDLPEAAPGSLPSPNYCVLFNPNNPPVDPENPPSEPYQERRTYVDTFGPNGGYTVGEDEAGFENGPSVNRFYGYGFDEEQVVYSDEVTIDTGEREYVVDTSNVWSRNTSSLEGRSGVMVTIQNGSTSIPTGGEVVCDGEKCEFVVTGDMGVADDLPPVYIDDEDGTGVVGRNIDSASEAASDAAERVPTDEIIGGLPDPTNPGELVDALVGA